MLLFDDLPDLVDIVIVELANLGVRAHSRRPQDIVRLGPADAVDRGQSDFDSLVRRKIHAGNTCHLKTSDYPCRCLCLGFTQITRTTRLRCTTLHLSQIFLTDALTFIKPTYSDTRSGPASDHRAKALQPPCHPEVFE